MKRFSLILMILYSICLWSDTLYLRENLEKAHPGDYIVTSINKNLTLMHIASKKEQQLLIEEIAVSESCRPLNWQQWINQDAPGHNHWVLYEIDLQSGQMGKYYSFTKKNWFEITEADNFLSKLLNLQFSKISDSERRKIGPAPISGTDLRPLWQPPMIVNGKQIRGVHFEAWKTRWPRDGGDLSGKVIEVYLPKENDLYPAYFPYWLKIYGTVGAARVRIVDSGNNLNSPKKFPLGRVIN